MSTDFRYESEMLGPAMDWMESLGLTTRPEFVTPWGVCDLVGVSLNPKNVEQRLASRQRRPLGPPSRIALLRQLPDEADGTFKTLGKLERELMDWLTPAEIREELERLIAWNYVTMPQENGYQKINGWAPLQERIVAVELKLTRVHEALIQAFANTRITLNSYVGLPEDRAIRVASSSRRNAFERLGVGLLAIQKSGCRILIEASSSASDIDSVIEMHCVERFWRTHLETT